MDKKYDKVRYELLRPGEIKAAREKCPVVYIPAGSLEWHGVQNPVGTDALKAHVICCEAALEFGGLVLPPCFLGIMGEGRGWGPEGWSGFTVNANTYERMSEAIYHVAVSLIANEWNVLIGVTGHDVEIQRDAMHDGIQRAVRNTDAKGFAVTEGENWEGGPEMKYSMDHAGAWETSCMIHAHPDRVSLDELRDHMAGGRADTDRMQMKEAEGIGGWNPLKYASADLGKDIIGFCAGRIGRKAMQVLSGEAEPPEKADKSFMDNPGA